jgi:iron complex outermembrane receptor protein
MKNPSKITLGREKTNRLLPTLPVAVLSVAISGVLFPAALLNAQSEEEEVFELSPFEVAAGETAGYYESGTTAGTRTGQRLIDIPGSITVLNEEFLDDIHGYQMSRALQYGVSGVTNNQEEEWDDIQIRGFRQFSQLRDGIPQLSYIRTPKYDIGAIEVLKGPAAMVFGESSILGGAVNLKSLPTTKVNTGSVDLILGDNNLRRLTINASGPIGDQDKETSLRYRVTIGNQNHDLDRSIESDDEVFYGGAFTVDFGKTTLDVVGYYYELDGYFYFEDPVDVTAPSPGPIKRNPFIGDDFVASTGNSFQDTEQYYYRATLTTQINQNHAFKVLYRYYQQIEDRRHLRGIRVEENNYILQRQDIPIQYDNIRNDFQFDYLGKISHGGFKGSIDHQISGGVAYTTGNDDNRLEVVPFDSIDMRDPDYSNDGNRPEPTWANTNSETNSTETSYYIQDVVTMFNGKLIAVGGFRWIKGDDDVTNLNTGDISSSETDTRRIYRIGAVYKPIDRISIYASKSTTFNLNPGDNHLGEQLKDSDGINEEIGLKFDNFNFLGGKVFGTIALFDMTLTNVRIVTVDDEGNNLVLQDAENTSEGIEFDIGFTREIGSGEFQSIFTASFMDIRDANGLVPVESPKQLWSFLFSYKFTEGALESLKLGFGGSFEGRKDTRFSRSTGYYIPSNEVFTAFARYTIMDNWELGVTIDNLTDDRSYRRAHTDGLAGRRRGQSVEFSLGYKW